jgi:hypothetical protein
VQSTFEHFVLVSVVFLYPLLLGIQYWKETFVAGMPEMVEVMKNQDKCAADNSVLFGYTSAKGVTSLTYFPALNLQPTFS